MSNRLNSVVSRTAGLQVMRDLAAPQITSVSGAGTKVIVQFSEPVDEASANNTASYTLSGGAKVQSAVLDESDLQTVTLTTTTLSFGTVYTLTVSGVKDRFGNAANIQAPFRATILIDGDFQDWAEIQPADTETQDTFEGPEFKDLYVANDDQYLYIRFNFYSDAGQLPVDNYFHIFSDTDNDAATGMGAAGIGSEMMIENGSGYQQKDGQFNEGAVRDLDFALAPATASSDFECRISRQVVFDSDGQPVYNGDTIALALQLISKNWAVLDTAPLSGGVVYTFTESTPLNPGPLHVRKSAGSIELTWSGPGVLEARDSLSGGTWAPVTNASSPFSVNPAGQQRYYRLKL